MGCVLPNGPIHLLIDSTGLKVFGAGEWLQEKHSAKARRTWNKLHLAVDADTGMIMASTLTGNDVGDPSQVAPLLDQIEATVTSMIADGAYDGMPTYDVVIARDEDIRVIIPPQVTVVLSAEAEHNPSQRDQHILSIASRGPLGWQEETDYGQRALVETAMGRANTRPLSVFAYGREAFLVSRLKWLSAWQSSTACWTRDARTPFVFSTTTG
jgi:transposase